MFNEFININTLFEQKSNGFDRTYYETSSSAPSASN